MVCEGTKKQKEQKGVGSGDVENLEVNTCSRHFLIHRSSFLTVYVRKIVRLYTSCVSSEVFLRA